MALISRKLSCSLYNLCCSNAKSTFTTSFYRRHHHHDHYYRVRVSLLFFSTVVDSSKPHFMADYLTSTCGFSRDEAIKLSKPLAHLKSLEKPDSVLSLLKQTGLDEEQIRKAIKNNPLVLCAMANKTLGPKIRCLKDLGFSGSEISLLISSNAAVLRRRDIGPKIMFLRTILGTNERLLEVIGKNHHILTSSLLKKIVPNVSLLRECGVSDKGITLLVWKQPRFFTSKVDNIRALIEQVREMGFPPGSRIFDFALYRLSGVATKTLEAKFKAFKSFGWSRKDFLFAIRKSPPIVEVSLKKIRAVMDFLLKEVGCEPSYVALHPVLLTLSVEKRLIPRHSVLNSLKLNGLCKRDFTAVMQLSNTKFVEKCILPYRDKIPELHEAYLVACAHRTPS